MLLSSPAQLHYIPKRIISVVPSQTQLLFDLGLEVETIGITKFCVHPQSWFKNKTRVGGTKSLDTEKIRSLLPDLIIANKEENVKHQVEQLAADFPVWVTDVNTLEDALQMIGDIGQLTHKSDTANSIKNKIQEEFNALPYKTCTVTACYLIWQKPFMTVGGDSFISNMMQHAGFENVFKKKQRYPEIDIDAIKNSGCDIMLLSSEPFPFTQKHVEKLQPLLPSVRIMLADGEMFSWYGSHLLQSPAYFKLLHEGLKTG